VVPQQSRVSAAAVLGVAPNAQVAANSQWGVRAMMAPPGQGIPADPDAAKAAAAKQTGCSNWADDSVTVSALGEDSLFVNADVVSGIVDANGAPSFSGQFLKLQYRADAKTPFYFGLGNSADRQLAPGQSALVTVVDPVSYGNRTQHLTVHYCKP
jgi:hypothetical protein